MPFLPPFSGASLIYQNQTKKMKKIFLFASVAVVAFSSCKKDADKEEKERSYKGEAKAFQHGSAWTWYEVDKTNKPLRIAIAIDDAAMASLDRGHGGDGGHNHANAVSLKLPAQANSTPFDHVLLEWNPIGHPPAGVYTKAHFDFHFYTTSEADRLAIPLYEQAKSKFDNFPAAGYLPANYVAIPEGVPQMGKHWVDVTSGEFTPAGFTQTFLYGSYDGKVTFYEPMITEEFLLDNPTFERSIPVPEKFAKQGWYPTKMRVSKANGATNIIIENFVQRQAN
jgi:hypothetical protein